MLRERLLNVPIGVHVQRREHARGYNLAHPVAQSPVCVRAIPEQSCDICLEHVRCSVLLRPDDGIFGFKAVREVVAPREVRERDVGVERIRELLDSDLISAPRASAKWKSADREAVRRGIWKELEQRVRDQTLPDAVADKLEPSIRLHLVPILISDVLGRFGGCRELES